MLTNLCKAEWSANIVNHLQDGHGKLTKRSSIRNPHYSSPTVCLYCWFVLYYTVFKLCLFSFSAPLTDKPPKILFPSENKISNMELQLGKSIVGFPPGAVSTICVISKWQEMDDFTNPLQHTFRRWTQIDDGTFICLRNRKRKKQL